MRFSVRPEARTSRARGFSRAVRVASAKAKAGFTSRRAAPLLQPSCFRGPPVRLEENRKLSQSTRPASPRGACVAARSAFRWANRRALLFRARRHRKTARRPSQRHPTKHSEPTHSWRTPLPTKPFHHFSLLGSHKNRCYYHQDLHWRRFQAASRRTLPHHRHVRLLVGAHSPRPPPSSGGPLQRHPFSGLVHSAGKLLHTSWRISTSRTTVLLSS